MWISQPRLNLAAAIAQCPFLGIRPPAPFTLGTLKTFGYALLDALKQALGLAPLYIPAAAPPGAVGGLTAHGSVEGLSQLGCVSSSSTISRVSFAALLDASAQAVP